MSITAYHSKYFAHELTLKSNNKLNNLSKSIFDAQIDINPHQIEAALFALNSPFSKGVLLADEVGLGKTIEAGLILCQYWVERKRNILIVCPSSLRKQWQNELLDKFNLPSVIMETSVYKKQKKEGIKNPFLQEGIIIISYPFASKMKDEIKLIPWHLAVIDEAHKLRNVYKPKSKTSQGIKWCLEDVKKILLTATPIQNNLMELYGLSQIIDEFTFGDIQSFRNNFIRNEDYEELKERMKFFVNRTLRKDVKAYINYTERHTITRKFRANDDEQRVYEMISDFLSKDNKFSVPSSQSQLITLVIRKILASSTKSAKATFEKILDRLYKIQNENKVEDLDFDDEDLISIIEEEMEEFEYEMGIENTNISEEVLDKIQLKKEIEEIKTIIVEIEKLKEETKPQELLSALQDGFENLKKVGANKKALIFTENKRTQEFLKCYLEDNGYKDKVVLFNGSNSSQEVKEIYENWLVSTTNKSESKTANIRMALVDYFKNSAEIMIATEAGAEGVNMQFCSMVINYDLPWNPQRVEQRIGRCHRYGQKNDVIVINFINERNLADVRVYELLSEKLNLFDGVLGASDSVLGAITSGVDFEKRILDIYNSCRDHISIKRAFDSIQKELEEEIKLSLEDTHKKILENFDEDVHDRLKLRETHTKNRLGKVEELFWKIIKFELSNIAKFNDEKFEVLLSKSNEKYILSSKAKNIDESEVKKLNINSGIGEEILNKALLRDLATGSIIFNISNRNKKISIIENEKENNGELVLTKVIIDGIEYEESLLFNGYIKRAGKWYTIDNEFCNKLFQCDGQLNHEDISLDNQDRLQEDVKIHVQAIVNEYVEKHDKEFAQQEEKLYKWAEDLEKGIEEKLEEVKNQIKKLQRDARKAINMDEKEKINIEIQDLEKEKKRQRKSIFEAQDEIEEKRDQLLETLKEHKKYNVSFDEIFKIKFKIV